MTSANSPTTHVILIDGSFASLLPGRDSSIGRIHAMLAEVGPKARLRVLYMPGQQWEAWGSLLDLAHGRNIPDGMTQAYGWLASRWHPGDSVFLFGYSRGAYAARSLAGMIGRVGLVRPEHATQRNIRLAWVWYTQGGVPRGLSAFRRRCHDHVPIRMIGVFDTIKSMGVRLPLLWLLTEQRHAYHAHHPGPEVEKGVHALALDETRAVFQPVLWETRDAAPPSQLKQRWFRGCHADIGGQLSGFEAARGLADIPLHYMLEEAEDSGLPLPSGWRNRLVRDPAAPSVGSWSGLGALCLARAPRLAGADRSEHLHPSVALPYPGPAVLTGGLAGLAADPVRYRRRLLRRIAAAPLMTPTSEGDS